MTVNVPSSKLSKLSGAQNTALFPHKDGFLLHTVECTHVMYTHLAFKCKYVL